MSKKRLTPEQQAIISASDAGHHATTIALASKLLANEPDNLRALIDLGHARWQLARYDEAENALERAIEICDEDKRDVIFGELGNLHRAKGNFSTAAEWFQKQIDTDPRDATGYLFLGSMQFRLGDLSTAAAILESGLGCEYGCLEELHYTLGLLLTAQERFDDAAIHFEKSLERDPNYMPAKVALKDVKTASQ